MKNLILFLILLAIGCNTSPGGEKADISTEEDRTALHNYIYEKTLEREAFSPAKEKNLDIDVKEEMQKVKDDFVNATNEEELYFAIKKMSCARKDRHLTIGLVKGGLDLAEIDGGVAPVRFLPDFGSEEIILFVSDVGSDIQTHLADGVEISLGDVLVEINGMNLAEFYNRAEPYIRYSTIPNLKRNFAALIVEKDKENFPGNFYQENLQLRLRKTDGSFYEVSLPYLDDGSIEFVEAEKHKYPGFTKAFERQTYHLYLPDDPGNNSLVMWWYGFREDLVKDIDHLVAYAEENDLLEHDLIIDLTDARGGSRGAYAIQRLSPKSFKTTFGNIKLSDMAEDFIERREDAYAKKQEFKDGTEKETDDDGTWLINWLRDDVVPRMEAGEEYSSNVPFKCAHAPHTSDGILEPAETHFKGRLVCLFGPKGGSHLDQFSAIVNDNNLGFTLGMPTGGYSNTWEGDEVLKFPGSGKPVVEYMWSLGHTIRPNGEILEGNPAMVDEFIPLTRDNFQDYVPMLLERAQAHLASGNKDE